MLNSLVSDCTTVELELMRTCLAGKLELGGGYQGMPATGIIMIIAAGEIRNLPFYARTLFWLGKERMDRKSGQLNE